MNMLFKSRHIGVAALIMGLSVLISRFMGLARDMVISHFYGASTESDIYFASFMVPDFINYLLAGGYFSITLIPVLSRCFAKNKEDGWKLFSAVFWWVSILIALFTAVAFIFAPELTEIVAPGFSEPSKERLAFFLRIILPAQAFFLPGACLTAILYLRRHFAIPALTPLIYNGAIIFTGVLLIDLGLTGFCVGVLIGAFLGSLLLPLWGAARGSDPANPDADELTGKFKLSFTLFHPELKKIFLLALPLMLGQSMVVLDEQFFRIFGSLTGEGGVSLLNYARRLTQVPVGVVAQAAGVASFPFLAQLAATNQTELFNLTLQNALKNVFAVLAPICAFMILAAQPIIHVIYQHGGFGAEDTETAAWLMRIMLTGVVFWGAQQLLGRAFYSRLNTLTPALCGTAATILFLPLYYYAAIDYGAQGIAALSVFGVAFYAALIAFIWAKKHGKAALEGTFRHGVIAWALSIAALVPAWLTLFVMTALIPDNTGGNLLAIIICGSVFSLFYLTFSRIAYPALLAPLAPFAKRMPLPFFRLIFPEGSKKP